MPGRDHLILDRFHWGETIWPEIFGRTSDFTEPMRLHTELYLQSRGALVVHCQGTASGIVQRLRGEPYPPADRVPDALRLFQEASDRSRLPVFAYDFETADGNVVDQLAFAGRRLEEWVTPVWQVTDHWVGNANARLLLVGDRPGPTTYDGGDSPFRPYGGCASHLLAAAAKLNSPLALTNARTRRGDVSLHALWQALSRPKVVALGNIADTALSGSDVPHGMIPHPQFVKRFWNQLLPQYDKMIKLGRRGERLTLPTRSGPPDPGVVADVRARLGGAGYRNAVGV